MSDPADFFSMAEAGLLVRVRVTPKAARNAVGEVVADEQGSGVLKVAVTAVPEKGGANDAVIKLLAKSWGLRRSDFQIKQGHTSRNKTLLIAGDGAILGERIHARLNKT